MRNTLSKIFVEVVESNTKAYLLSGDHGYALFDPLRKHFPEHFINAGVAEQNMVGVGAGLAKSGLLPIIYGLGAFLPNRVLEQIKLDICYEKLKVIFVGDGAGAVYSTLGVSHQTFEDIAVLRSLPNLKIFSPCDSEELKWSFDEALKYQGPSFIRIGKSDMGENHELGDVIDGSGLTLLSKGLIDKPIILATGSMVSTCRSLVENDFPEVSVYSVCKLKPLDENELSFIKENSSFVVTVEEHNVYGGLGSIVAEIVTTHFPKRVIRIGANDCFTETCGTYEHVMSEHGLSKDKLKKRFEEIFHE
jgi:transketolase